MPTLLMRSAADVHRAELSCSVNPERDAAGGLLPLSMKPSSITVVVIAGFLFATAVRRPSLSISSQVFFIRFEFLSPRTVLWVPYGVGTRDSRLFQC
jgi:hypothetical protein